VLARSTPIARTFPSKGGWQNGGGEDSKKSRMLLHAAISHNMRANAPQVERLMDDNHATGSEVDFTCDVGVR